MLILAALLLCYAGMAGFALAMRRHHRELTGRDPGPARRAVLRLGAVACLGSAFLLTVRANGPSIGPVAWFGLVFVAGLAFVFLQAFKPGPAAAVALLTLPAAALLAACGFLC